MGLKVKRVIHKAQSDLKKLKGGRLEVGWIDGQKYENGMLVAQVAYIQEYGANLPGGQPYFFDKEGNIQFMSRSKLGNGAEGKLPKGAMGITKPSRIPPSGLLRKTVARDRRIWQYESKKLAKRVIEGKMTVEEGLEALGLKVRSSIQEGINNMSTPKNSFFTIQRKGFDGRLKTNSKAHLLRDSIRTKVEVKG